MIALSLPLSLFTLLSFIHIHVLCSLSISVSFAAAFSSKTYVVLKQFAESLAKLALRLDVMEQDVIGAIFHCENFVRKIFGAGDFPPPAVSTLNVIAKVDTSMNLFTRWLYQYLDRYEKQVV